MRGSSGSVGNGSLAGSSSRTPIPVGVAGRETCRTPSSSVTVTATGTGRMAWVAASENSTEMGWSLRCSEKQNESLEISSPSTRS